MEIKSKKVKSAPSPAPLQQLCVLPHWDFLRIFHRHMLCISKRETSEALDLLAEECDSPINHGVVYKKLLRKKGFIQHKALLKNGRKLNGKEFCAEMTKVYRSGERIFAHLGRCHVGAVLPTKGVDGRPVYKIFDSWDSSSRLVGEFWVSTIEKSKEKSKPESAEFIIEDEICHPNFGKGVIISVQNDTLTVLFEKGERRLSVRWVQAFAEKRGLAGESTPFLTNQKSK